MNQTDQIGLLGGTFDPIHLGHTFIAEWIQFKFNLNKVIFIPINRHPFNKRNDLISSEFRLKMLEIAFDMFPTFEISTYEADKHDTSYTIDTIRYFRGIYPDQILYYLIGSDNVSDFSKWKEPKEIVRLAQVVVYPRPGYPIPPSRQNRKFIFVDSPRLDISSSNIRQAVRNQGPYRSLLHPGVYQFIVDNHLYLS